MKKNFLILLMLNLFVVQISANTTRDLPDTPVYDSVKIAKHVMLCINFERINSGLPAFAAGKKLNAAAKWHSDYMAKEGRLFHLAGKKDMRDVQQRVMFFGEKIDRFAEILSFSYSVNAGEIPFAKKTDSKGEYIDFGKETVRWMGQTEIAMSIFNSILKNRDYAGYLSNEKLNAIGGGISAGKGNGLDGWYGSFAVVEKKDLLMVRLKAEMKHEVVRKISNGKEIEENVVNYEIAGFIEPKAFILAVSPAGDYRVFDYSVINGRLNIRIDDQFRDKLNGDEKLYAATYDKENEAYYPLLRLEVLK
jgi:hypothetical protein